MGIFSIDADWRESDAQAIIDGWIKDPDNIAYLRQLGVGVYTPEEMQTIATNLRNDIIGGFGSIQRTPLTHNNGGDFDMRRLIVQSAGDNQIVIPFNPASLRRNSLMGRYGPTGGGINDIFALFTHGWNAKRYVYGSWKNAYQRGWRSKHSRRPAGFIRSRLYYPGNPWIAHIVKAYEMEYPGLKITYPSEWGG